MTFFDIDWLYVVTLQPDKCLVASNSVTVQCSLSTDTSSIRRNIQKQQKVNKHLVY